MNSRCRPYLRTGAFVFICLFFIGCATYQDRRREMAMAHYSLGDAELRKGRGIDNELNRRQAYPEFLRAVELDPDNPLYRIGLGNIYLYNRDFEKAEKHFKTAIRLDPDNSMAHQNLGQAYMATGRYEQSIKEFDLALKNYAYPTPYIAYWNKGRAYFQLKNCEEAIRAFQAALDISPNLEGAWFQLGVCLENQGKYNEAKKALEQALAILPDSAPSHYYMGLILFRQNKRTEAIDSFKNVVDLDPDSDYGKNAARYLSILE